jgi:hypothetical protein
MLTQQRKQELMEACDLIPGSEDAEMERRVKYQIGRLAEVVKEVIEHLPTESDHAAAVRQASMPIDVGIPEGR